MASKADRHLWPHAIYFDTNPLRAIGPHLRAGWFHRLRSLADEAGTKLRLPQLVVEEYITELTNETERKSRQSTDLADDVDRLLDLDIERPGFPNVEVLAQQIAQIQKKRLLAAGFRIFPNARLNLDALLREAVAHVPPFQQQDKGFRDAVILESIKADALSNFDKPHVFIISGDRAFKDGIARLRSVGVDVACVPHGEEAAKAFDAALSSARHEMLEETRRALLHYLRGYEREHVEAAKKVESSSATFVLAHIEELRDGQVRSIRCATRLGISWVDLTPRDIEWAPSAGKRPIRVGVDFEFEMMVEYGTPGEHVVLGPSVQVGEIGEGERESLLTDQFYPGLPVASHLGVNIQPEPVKITLSVLVEAEIDKSGFDEREFGGLRIIAPDRGSG